MNFTNTYIRVRYAETDKMGYVYYGNYAQYFEVGRVDLFRSIGMSYKELEDNGVMMPVLNMQIDYHKPAHYDDLLRIETSIPEIPKGARIKFGYKIYNEKDELLTKAQTELAFISMANFRPVRMPQKMAEKMKLFFENTNE